MYLDRGGPADVPLMESISSTLEAYTEVRKIQNLFHLYNTLGVIMADMSCICISTISVKLVPSGDAMSGAIFGAFLFDVAPFNKTLYVYII